MRSSTVCVQKQTIATVDDSSIAAYEVFEEMVVQRIFNKNTMHVTPLVGCDVGEMTVVANEGHIIAIYGVIVVESVEEDQCVSVEKESVNFVCFQEIYHLVNTF